ncbi:MAG: GTPase, partial [Tenuifilum sp.]|uniref:ribosome biogenesis GTPase Der n=1 Tax=Tenuifilum sp. TaxID=2760880 RepID=UPI0024AA30FB
NIRMQAAEFYSLGLGDPWCVSSINGSGTGDLLDEVIKHFDETPETDDAEGIPRIAVVGRPNVGKSSLINTFIGEERNIVTPIAGTTRDAIDTHYRKFGHEFIIVDTAGLRRKNRVKEDLEFYSVMRSVRAIESSDVCLLLIDATQGLERQDMNIFSLIVRNKKGVVLVVNKWDLVEKDNKTMKEYTELLKERLAPFNDIPIVFASALTKQRVFKVVEEAMQVYENRKRRVSTSELNNFLHETLEIKQPPIYKGKFVKIKYVTQLPTRTPQFAFFCNLPQYIKDPYKRFLENRLRERFNFSGVPIQIYFREK